MAIQPVQLQKSMEQVHPVEQQTPRQSSTLGADLRRLAAMLVFNLLPFVIVGSFFWLQIQIDRRGGWFSKVEIGFSVLVEFGLIFVWSLFLKNER